MSLFPRLLLALLAGCLSLLCGHTGIAAAPGKVFQSPEPAWVDKIPVPLTTAIKPSDVSYGYHQLLQDLQYDVASKTVYQHQGYLVLTDEGLQSASEIRVDYDPNFQKVYFHRVSVWRDGRPINQLNLQAVKVMQREKNLERHIYDESLTAVLFLEDVRVGDAIEYAYSVVGRNPAFNDTFFTYFYLQHYDPIDEIFVKIRAPKDRKLNYKATNNQEKPTITATADQVAYVWHRKAVPGLSMDEEVPGWYNPYPAVYVSEFGNWKEVAKWGHPLYEQEESLSQELKAKIAQIRKDYPTDEGRLTAALRFVQDEVRYLGLEAGIGGYRPSAPSTVFARRFGDCKDKSLLLSTILRQLGLEAYPALVNSTYQEQITEWLPMPYAFDHCIVQVVHYGRTLWYDPTITQQRGKHDQLSLPAYKRALVIKADSEGLVRVSAPSAASTKIFETFFFKDVGEPVTLNIKTEYRGADADFQRSKFAATSLKEMEKGYLNYYAAHYPNIAAAVPLVFYDNEQENLFTTLEEYTIKEMWLPKEDDEAVQVAEFYPQMIRDRIKVPSSSIRTMPVGQYHPLDLEQTTELHLSEPWPVKDNQTEVTHDAFRYAQKISYQPQGNLITIHLAYKTLRDHVPAEAVADYIKKQNKVLKDLGYFLTYNQAMATLETDSESARFNWLLALVALLFLGAAVIGAYRVFLYDPRPLAGAVYRAEEIGGWLFVVGFGLIVTPFALVINILSNSYFNLSNSYFNLDVWEALTTASSPAHNPGLAAAIVLELFVQILLLVYVVLLIRLFLQKRSSLPRLISIFYLANFGTQILLIWLTMAVGAYDAQEAWSEGGKEIIRGFIAACIWVPYFNRSERVKRTFVQSLHPADDALEQPEEQASHWEKELA